MKLLFLDINGVLETTHSASHLDFDPYCVKHLRNISENLNLGIVITSNWRIGKTIEEMKKLFLKHSINVIGMTPAIPYAGREAEIQEFIDNAPYTHGIEIEDFVILDDDNEYPVLSDHLVQTNYNSGLDYEASQQVIRKISKNCYK